MDTASQFVDPESAALIARLVNEDVQTMLGGSATAEQEVDADDRRLALEMTLEELHRFDPTFRVAEETTSTALADDDESTDVSAVADQAEHAAVREEHQDTASDQVQVVAEDTAEYGAEDAASVEGNGEGYTSGGVQVVAADTVDDDVLVNAHQGGIKSSTHRASIWALAMRRLKYPWNTPVEVRNGTASFGQVSGVPEGDPSAELPSSPISVEKVRGPSTLPYLTIDKADLDKGDPRIVEDGSAHLDHGISVPVEKILDVVPGPETTVDEANAVVDDIPVAEEGQASLSAELDIPGGELSRVTPSPEPTTSRIDALTEGPLIPVEDGAVRPLQPVTAVEMLHVALRRLLHSTTDETTENSVVVPHDETGVATVHTGNRGTEDDGVADTANNALSHALPVQLSDATHTSEDAQAFAVEERQQTITCAGCLERKLSQNTMIAPCGDVYCAECLATLFQLSTTNEALHPPSCCQQPISLVLALPLLPISTATSFRVKSTELDTKDRTYCCVSSCSTFIPPSAITDDIGTCHTCQMRTCSLCKLADHYGECSTDETFRNLIDMADAEGWQFCYSCKSLVELDTGCFHIRCRCGAQFCYVCGRKWKTCGCAQADERRLLTVDPTQNGDARCRQIRGRRLFQPPNGPRSQVYRGPPVGEWDPIPWGIVRPPAPPPPMRSPPPSPPRPEDCGRHFWNRVGGPENCDLCGDTMEEFIHMCANCRSLRCRRCRGRP